MQQGSSEGGRDSTSAGAYLHCAAILVVSHHHPAGVAGEALRRSRGNVAHLFELGLAESLRIRQHGGVDVNHDLVALARRPGVELMVQGGLGEQGQGIGLLLHPGRSIDDLASWAWPRSLIEGLAGGIERSDEQGTRFRSQATTDYHRAVVVPIDLEHAALVLVSGLTDLGIPVHLTPSPYDVLHVHCTPAPPPREQARLGLRGGDTGECAHLGVRQLPAGKRLGQSGQRVQSARDAHVLPGGSGGHADPPGEPFRAGAEPGVPPPARVELADQAEQPRGGGVEVGGQLGDLIAEALQVPDPRGRGNQGRKSGRGLGGGRGGIHRHRESPSTLICCGDTNCPPDSTPRIRRLRSAARSGDPAPGHRRSTERALSWRWAQRRRAERLFPRAEGRLPRRSPELVKCKDRQSADLTLRRGRVSIARP